MNPSVPARGPLAGLGIVVTRPTRQAAAFAQKLDSEGLLALRELTDVRGRRVIVFRGDGGRDLLADTLRGRGARVVVVPCYRRAVPSSGAVGLLEALRERRAHAITVTSSEGVENLWSILCAEGRRLIATLPVFAPHPRIAERVRLFGMQAIETACGDAGLITGLLEWAASAPAPRSGAGF